MKKALNDMKKKVLENKHLDGYYKTTGFTVNSEEYLTSKSINMINVRQGYITTNSGKMVIVNITDEYLINFFTKLNLAMYDVKGFFFSNGEIGFRTLELSERRNKKPIETLHIEYTGKLMPNTVGNVLQFGEDNCFIEYKESRTLFREDISIKNFDILKSKLTDHDLTILSTGLDVYGCRCLIVKL